ncbi:MAG TPA: VOC family protein [Acidimicrobiia bacterium]|jgi:catechol 2,3-dioxygenase-like lactoylglutathione lyase family enzyme
MSERREPGVHVVAFDHVVLNVADTERALAFYLDDLGLEPARVDEWRRGEAPFPSARVDAGTVIDFVDAPRTGKNADHVCLVVEPTDLDALKASGRFEVVDGPAPRWGARGTATSLYVLDPDGNTVELRYYGEALG